MNSLQWKKKAFVLALCAATTVPAALASDNTARSGTEDSGAVNNAAVQQEKPAPSGYELPLAGFNRKLNNLGITTSAVAVEMLMGNPTAGIQTMHQESLTMITSATDFNMQKLTGARGATIHFEYLWVPVTRNVNNYGGQVGDSIIGQPPPYIPQMSHLTRFSWEQKVFNNKLTAEFGKGNVSRYFGLPVCNQEFTCVSPILQWEDGPGMNPPPYGNWFARLGYQITPALTLQAGAWRSTADFPITNGWELEKKTLNIGSMKIPLDSNVYGLDLSYRTSYQTKKLPTNAEFFYWHNTATQSDALTGNSHRGTNGLYAGVRQTVLRLPQGARPFPKAITSFASITSSLDTKPVSGTPNTGLQTTGNFGFAAEGLLNKRPFDSFGFKATWMRVTDAQYKLMQQYNPYYTAGSTEWGIGPDATFVFSKFVLLPYATRSFGANQIMNISNTAKIKDGWGGGVMMVVLLDKILGTGPVVQH